ncbi:MAG TPA: tetratricopeptide repeat protein [Labilithrix sp.]|nr:tetratricopeptide repeat protein [Labilithrix sp.]
MHDTERLIATAHARPDDVSAQIAAAYACDRAGDEARAIAYYDSAWRLGVPSLERADFIIGYGSTLRNVGRTDEALRVLADLLRDEPDNHAARCFYGLALHSAGRDAVALAELLEVVLSLQGASQHITSYRRALAAYCEELRTENKAL